MARGVSSSALRPLVFVGVVLFALWRPLLAGGTLAPDDQAWSSAPFNAEAPAGISIEVAEPDAIAIHSMWTRWADDLRDGELTHLGDGRTGAPTLADGLPMTHLLYVLVPSWYAPGLVAAAAVLLAMFGMARLLDRLEVGPEAALFGGLAFGLCGPMFFWLGWPHATAFALVPWVLTAAHDAARQPDRRRALALAAWTTALLWCGVFAISAYTLIGVVAVVAFHRRSRRSWSAALAGIVTGVALASPHLLASSSRWNWADTAAREVGDSSASVASSLTVALGSFWGNDAVGFPWIGSSSAQLSVGFVGMIVTTLALVGFVAGRPGHGRLAAVLVVAGFGIAYVGGPFSWLSQGLAGDGAEMTHARVLLVIGIVALAAEGLHALGVTEPQALAASLSRRRAVAGGGVIAVLAAWSLLDWLDAARAGGAVRAALAETVPSLLVLAVAGAVAVAWWRRTLAAPALIVTAITLTTFELLSFGMPIPTVTDRSERLEATEAHDVLHELVGDDGLIVADGRTLLPATSARFGPADVRIPRLRSSQEIVALIAAEDASVRAGATPEQPTFSSLDPTDPLWTRLGVDAFAVAPGRLPPGPTAVALDDAFDRIDPAGRAFSTRAFSDIGVRAVLLDLEAPVGTEVQVDVGAVGRLVFGDTVVVTGSPVVVPVEGDALTGSTSITVRVFSEPGTSTLGVDSTGNPTVGIVGGAPDSELVITDGLLIVHRPTPHTTVEGAADVTMGSVDDRSMSFVVRSTDIVAVWTDILDRPGWEVSVDGQPGYLLRDLVLGVELGPGEHEVEFSYRPPGLFAGLLIIAATFVGWLLAGPVLGARGSRSSSTAAGSVTSRD